MTEPYISQVIRALKAERVRQGLSQVEVGQRIGRPKSRISEIENGKTQISFSTLEDYAAAIGFRFALMDASGRVVRPGQREMSGPKQESGTAFDDVFVPDPDEEEPDDAPRP